MRLSFSGNMEISKKILILLPALLCAFMPLFQGCQDDPTKAPRCQLWKKDGFCAISSPHEKFMSRYCPRTCERCINRVSSTRSGLAKTQDNCKDTPEYLDKCANFKSSGFCTPGHVYYRTMLRVCRKTCNLCKIDISESVCGRSPANLKGRVVGGQEAAPNSWPWQVGLVYDKKFDCGGTLVSKDWVMTAAHCAFKRNATKFNVVLGEHDWDTKSGFEQSRSVTKIIVHSGFNFVDLLDDIALIKLSKPANITKQVQHACLPGHGDVTSSAVSCFITGWGKTDFKAASARKLQEASLPVVTNKECSQLNVKIGTGRAISPGMLCAGFGANFSRIESGCRGDSGGPLACHLGADRWSVEGVVSSGSSTCRAFEKYTVFTRVSYYRKWIDDVMSKN